MADSITRFRCVVFDAVGTLIHARPEVANVYQRVAARHGAALTLAELKIRFQQAMSSRHVSARTDEESELQFWRETVQTVIGLVNDPEACFQELYQHFACADAWQLGADVSTTLEKLRQHGIHTAIASNFDQRLRQIVTDTPELRSLDHVVISSEVGWRKPHREFFEAVIETVQVPAGEILMVGDDLQLDILPARERGMEALHLLPAGAPASLHNTRSIESLQAVLKWCGIDG